MEHGFGVAGEGTIIERKEKTGKYPKAIVSVSNYGTPYQIDEKMEIAGGYGIPVVEDAAEGFGYVIIGRGGSSLRDRGGIWENKETGILKPERIVEFMKQQLSL